MKDDDTEEKDEPISLAELSRREEESSRKVMQRLTLPSRIGEAMNSAAWLFVVCGVLLNINGYGYVVKDNHMITIDTLENRQFQLEIRKSMKESPNEMRHQ
jgi:hypothetical protein